MRESVTSLELYLENDRKEVVTTEKLQDVACGMYPCYYRLTDDELRVSKSVFSLILDAGEYDRNTAYEVPQFIQKFDQKDKQIFIEDFVSYLPQELTSRVPSSIVRLLRESTLLPNRYWDDQMETIARGIYRLQPFETILSDGTQNVDIAFDRSISSKEKFIELSCQYLTEFVQNIEKRFPEHEHIVLTGGRDSLLIHLVPKLTDNWSAFSAEPNLNNTLQFFEDNGIDMNQVYTHSNTNRETIGDTVKKLICSDLRADPRHIRWRPKLAEISKQYDRKCIFWSGTEGDTINSYYSDFHDSEEHGYFDLQMMRAANWQGTTHQTTTNYTGAPMISIYHSPQIWQDLYRRYDPEMIQKGDDLRDEIGEQLHGGSVVWPSNNPGPKPYRYERTFDPVQAYEQLINYCLTHESQPRLPELDPSELERFAANPSDSND
ncbi:hypothetical protein [Halorubrum salipaludis]|uniref:hypothetical protein n=1 Tax=Halorubrum salipaludis TaxID=2032630 RepID=UPI00118195A7|nr:hypothetical protein [Halorubrum salipaludis]